MSTIKLPRTHTELDALLHIVKSNAYWEGYEEGRIKERTIANIQQEQQRARLRALEQITALAKTFSDTTENLTRAMCSEAGQL